MPFVLAIIGLTLLVSGVRNTQDDLFKLIQNDFTGQNSFVPWIVAMLIIGSLGYIEPIKPVSRTFLVLVVIVLFLSKNSGIAQGITFFKNFTDTLKPYSAGVQK